MLSHNLDTWMVKRLIHVVLIIKQILACDYVPPSDDEVTVAVAEYPQHSRTKRNPIWDWMRIETVYDPSFHHLSEEKKELLKDLIVAARDYFETTIKVYRLSSLQLQASCKGFGGIMYKRNGTVVCPADCQKRCGRAIAPLDAPFFTHCYCSPHECITQQTDWGGKLRNADFILFVSVLGDGCKKQTLAYATHCARDPATKRPVAGQVNICPNAFDKMTANEISQWESTIKHELIHALVFSTRLFEYFPGAGLSRRGVVSIIPNVLHRYIRTNWETSKGPTNHGVFMLVTPKVREEARRHFNCSTLEGAEIESQGSGGTAGSHWEKRVFENEAMSGVATQVYAFSRLTLALFEDSGWYKVDYNTKNSGSEHITYCDTNINEILRPLNCLSSRRVVDVHGDTRVASAQYCACHSVELCDMSFIDIDYSVLSLSAKAESMPWGRNLGCTFAKQSCLTWMKSNLRDPYPFCTVYEETRCSTSRKEKVKCNMLTNSRSLPREYNYNIRNLYRDKKGRSIVGHGSVELADFCPYYKIYGDVSREDSDTRCTYPDNKHYNNYSLEVFSPTARCFDLDGGIRVRNERGTITWLHSVGCYETICKDGRLMIKTQSSKFYPCYQEGQFIHVEKRIYGVGTVTTRIVCPPCTELCGAGFCAPDKFVYERIGDPTRSAIQLKPELAFMILPLLLHFS